MKNLILILGLTISLCAFAAESEPGWKTPLRNLITKIAGTSWADKLIGAPPTDSDTNLAMPEIPKQVKNNTDVTSYTKLTKNLTEFDNLPAEKKKQFDFKFLKELFQVTRKSEAKDEDLSDWLNILDQGSSREGIYQALVLDEVYSSLENIEERPSPKLLNFSLKFSEKYLNQTFKQENLSQLNLYSLKRILTEKGLDLLEFYETKDLDALYRWYANFSKELGAEHATLLNSKIREESSAQFHYEWAKGMPIQHIKSEFIVKLHSVMNGLQLDE